MKRFFLAMLLMALPLAAQEEKKAEAKPTVQKLFVLKYADPQSVRNLLQVFQASLNANRDLRILAVDASPDTMAVIEDAIKRLDVPSAAPANIDLTVYMVVGHEGESTASSAPVPKELDPVVTQLKGAFAFKSYSLLDVLALRTRTGQPASTSSSGGAMQSNGGQLLPLTTRLRLDTASVGDDRATIHINKLNASFNVPTNNNNYQNLSLETDIDIKEGQKVVIGRLGISQDQALFLVMTVKILQ